MVFLPGLEQVGIYELPLTLVLISIMLAGICLGVGLAFSSVKLKNFGKEELFQALVNAAMLGALAVLIITVDSTLDSFVTDDVLESCNVTELQNSSLMMDYVTCKSDIYLGQAYDVQLGITRSTSIMFFMGDMSLNLGVVTSSPFNSMTQTAETLSSLNQTLNVAVMLMNLESLLLRFIIFICLPILLPLGFIFRSFFVTRKMGAILISVALSFYVIYPLFLFISLPFLDQHEQEMDSTLDSLNGFSTSYSYIPMMDMNRQSEVINSINIMSSSSMNTGNIVDEVYHLSRKVTVAVSNIFFYVIVFHLLALVITLVSIIQLYKVLATEFVAPVFDKL